MLHRLVKGFSSVCCFADNDQVRLSFKKQPQTLPEDPLILSNEQGEGPSSIFPPEGQRRISLRH